MAGRTFDIAVIGGGIVGLATAWACARAGGGRVAVIEAEPGLARHQSGRNSGVIHSGLYYRPGSQKAFLCTSGRELLYRFCQRHAIAHRRCGKLVVATTELQLTSLAELEGRAAANGLDGVERIDEDGLHELEPAACGIAGLLVPQTGVVDFADVTETLASLLRRLGGEVLLAARVRHLEPGAAGVRIEAGHESLDCGLLIGCAGLQADRLARLAGLDPQLLLLPFRGEYFELVGEARNLVRGLIYPVPDPQLPFLGVHFTRTVDDRVLLGPNAVLAGKREGYRRTDLSLTDLVDTLSFPGSWRLARSYWRTGLGELSRSLSRRRFLEESRRLVPAIPADSLRPAPSGVRAQAVDDSGKLLDDFRILQTDRMIHVLNAPSPAATAALAIGRHLAGLAGLQASDPATTDDPGGR